MGDNVIGYFYNNSVQLYTLNYTTMTYAELNTLSGYVFDGYASSNYPIFYTGTTVWAYKYGILNVLQEFNYSNTRYLNTSTATATANDIVSGKTAYSQGSKVTGALIPIDVSGVTATASDVKENKVFVNSNGDEIQGTFPNATAIYDTITSDIVPMYTSNTSYTSALERYFNNTWFSINGTTLTIVTSSRTSNFTLQNSGTYITVGALGFYGTSTVLIAVLQNSKYIDYYVYNYTTNQLETRATDVEFTTQSYITSMGLNPINNMLGIYYNNYWGSYSYVCSINNDFSLTIVKSIYNYGVGDPYWITNNIIGFGGSGIQYVSNSSAYDMSGDSIGFNISPQELHCAKVTFDSGTNTLTVSIYNISITSTGVCTLGNIIMSIEYSTNSSSYNLSFLTENALVVNYYDINSQNKVDVYILDYENNSYTLDNTYNAYVYDYYKNNKYVYKLNASNSYFSFKYGLVEVISGFSYSNKLYLDTSDANATVSDLALGKTAYVNGNKLTGTYETIDLENIYGSNSATVILENIQSTNNIKSLIDLDDCVIYGCNNDSTRKMDFYKYDKNSEETSLIYSQSYVSNSSYYGSFVAHYKNDKLYTYFSTYSTNNGMVTCIDLNTQEIISTSAPNKLHNYKLIHRDENGFAMYTSYNDLRLWYYSLETNSFAAIFTESNGWYSVGYSDYVCPSRYSSKICYKNYVDYENKTYTRTTVISSYSADSTISFINLLENKVIFGNGDVYEINNDKSVTNKINTVSLTNMQMIGNNLVYSANKIYEFNETTNDFDIKFENVNNLFECADYIPILYNSSNTAFSTVPSQDTIIGFEYNNKYYQIKNTISIVSDKVLVNTNNIFDEAGNVVAGTMPNNGTLSYIPSTSQQTIPEGYTSGGTIAAVELTNEDYATCLDLTEQILGGDE